MLKSKNTGQWKSSGRSDVIMLDNGNDIRITPYEAVTGERYMWEIHISGTTGTLEEAKEIALRIAQIDGVHGD
jgi:hypothetical protein